MKKSDLKNGMVVETRQGKRYVYSNNNLVSLANFDEIVVENIDMFYREDLSAIVFGPDNDIIKVFTLNDCPSWERPTEILTPKEKEYLTSFIKPFKKEVDWITKESVETLHGDEGKQRLIIKIGENWIIFPPFEKDKLYSGMKVGDHYSLEFLGLE